MSSSPWHRLLYPGLLLFGLSLALSKSASNILLAALYLSAIIGAISNKEFRDDIIRNCRQPLTAALALFCLVAYAGIIHTEKISDGFGIANKFVSLPAIYFFVSVLLQSEPSAEARTRKAEFLLFFFLIGLTALNLLGVLKYLGAIGDAPFSTPLSPLGMHHIWYANLNALGLYTAAALLLFTRHGRSARGRALLGGFLLLSTLGVLLSTSRTSWFGIVLTAAIMAAATIRRPRTIVIALLLSLLSLTAVYRYIPLVRDRVDLAAQDIARFSENKHSISSTGGRLVLWEATISMVKEHPLVGIGTGDFEHHMRLLRRAKLLPTFVMGMNQPHNIYLFSLATNGIVGLAALLSIFYRSLRSAIPALRIGGEGKVFAFLALAVTVHFMIAGFMDSFFNIQVLRYAFAFLTGICIRNGATRDPGVPSRKS